MQLGNFCVSLAVKDIAASKTFYAKLGFAPVGGGEAQGWLILKNGDCIVGEFQGMFEKNTLTSIPPGTRGRDAGQLHRCPGHPEDAQGGRRSVRNRSRRNHIRPGELRVPRPRRQPDPHQSASLTGTAGPQRRSQGVFNLLLGRGHRRLVGRASVTGAGLSSPLSVKLAVGTLSFLKLQKIVRIAAGV